MNQGIGTQVSPKSTTVFSNNSRAYTKRRHSIGVGDLLSMQIPGKMKDSEMHAKIALVQNQMNISDIIPGQSNHKRSFTQTDTANILKDRKKSGIISPNSGVSSFGGYQVTDPKLPDDMSDADFDLNKIISESMPKHYSLSRYPR